MQNKLVTVTVCLFCLSFHILQFFVEPDGPTAPPSNSISLLVNRTCLWIVSENMSWKVLQPSQLAQWGSDAASSCSEQLVLCQHVKTNDKKHIRGMHQGIYRAFICWVIILLLFVSIVFWSPRLLLISLWLPFQNLGKTKTTEQDYLSTHLSSCLQMETPRGTAAVIFEPELCCTITGTHLIPPRTSSDSTRHGCWVICDPKLQWQCRGWIKNK